MLVLSMETADKAASVAVLDNLTLVASKQLPLEIRSAQSLAGGIQDILSETGLKPTDIQLVATAQGPGSFTGLRVGVVAAKVFAWAVNAQIIGVSTLRAIAENAPQNVQKISAALDCQRGQVVYQQFVRSSEGTFIAQSEELVVDTEDWLNQSPDDFYLSGPILARTSVWEMVHGQKTVNPEFWTPTAAGIGKLAVQMFEAGQRDDIWQLLPRYSRPAAAEEKRLARIG